MLETLSLMGMGFIHAMNPLTLVLMIGATALGITIGCLPGLSAAMGVALLLPVTFGMDRLRRYLLRRHLRRIDFRDSDSYPGYACFCRNRY